MRKGGKQANAKPFKDAYVLFLFILHMCAHGSK